MTLATTTIAWMVFLGAKGIVWLFGIDTTLASYELVANSTHFWPYLVVGMLWLLATATWSTRPALAFLLTPLVMVLFVAPLTPRTLPADYQDWNWSIPNAHPGYFIASAVAALLSIASSFSIHRAGRAGKWVGLSLAIAVIGNAPAWAAWGNNVYRYMVMDLTHPNVDIKRAFICPNHRFAIALGSDSRIDSPGHAFAVDLGTGESKSIVRGATQIRWKDRMTDYGNVLAHRGRSILRVTGTRNHPEDGVQETFWDTQTAEQIHGDFETTQ